MLLHWRSPFSGVTADVLFSGDRILSHLAAAHNSQKLALAQPWS
jgi:hypothetical protein